MQFVEDLENQLAIALFDAEEFDGKAQLALDPQQKHRFKQWALASAELARRLQAEIAAHRATMT